MAIDSESKRKRAMEAGYGFGTPYPDGTIGTIDRAWLLGLYYGIGEDADITPLSASQATLAAIGPSATSLERSGASQATMASTGPASAALNRT